jgi:hypothetical protein
MNSGKPYPFKGGYKTCKPKTAMHLYMFAIEEAVFQYMLNVELFFYFSAYLTENMPNNYGNHTEYSAVSSASMRTSQRTQQQPECDSCTTV